MVFIIITFNKFFPISQLKEGKLGFDMSYLVTYLVNDRTLNLTIYVVAATGAFKILWAYRNLFMKVRDHKIKRFMLFVKLSLAFGFGYLGLGLSVKPFSQRLGVDVMKVNIYASNHKMFQVRRVICLKIPLFLQNFFYFFQTIGKATSFMHLTNGYGLFTTMTGVGGRPEFIIEVEGKNGVKIEAEIWAKVGRLDEIPPFIIPIQAYVSWQVLPKMEKC